MTTIQILGINAIVLFVYVTALWVASLISRDAGIVDSFWGLGLVVSAVVFFIFSGGFETRKILVLVLVAVWGLRLSFYIFRRSFARPEDPRYQSMRAERGTSFWWVSYFQVFVLQGITMWIVSVCLVAAQNGSAAERLTGWDFAGIVIWLAGFLFESVSDGQLARFKRNPENQGRVLDRGLWRYTRHPNYFGEVLVWWGYYLLAVAAGGWWTFFSPIVMTVLILRVSGVTRLEKRQAQTKPDYQDYVESTSVFVPWRSKRPRALVENDEGGEYGASE
ncbi:MAG: 3-oxo-5-alpha-steroid 4-dehydrogenase [Actinobacteria bacterium ADurb.Bin444]|nr:MAG: 3-oxo-5-alpha-steroid 4-dehydrogenase [Actinobacteria bacterium ADurb.Bin444]